MDLGKAPSRLESDFVRLHLYVHLAAKSLWASTRTNLAGAQVLLLIFSCIGQASQQDSGPKSASMMGLFTPANPGCRESLVGALVLPPAVALP